LEKYLLNIEEAESMYNMENEDPDIGLE